MLTSGFAIAEVPCDRPPPQKRPSIDDCAAEVLRYLSKNQEALRANPSAAFNALTAWDQEFNKYYWRLRAAGHDFSRRDAEIIHAYLADVPVSLAKGAALEYIVVRWFQRLSGFVAFLGSASVQAVSVFFIPSQPASDLDMLVDVNELVHKRLGEAVFPPWNETDWQREVANAMEQRNAMGEIGIRLP